MSDLKVVDLNDRVDDARFMTPKRLLEESAAECGVSDAFEKGRKLLVICLDDTDDQYNVSWRNAGLKTSEIVSLLEYLKDDMMRLIKGAS